MQLHLTSLARKTPGYTHPKLTKQENKSTTYTVYIYKQDSKTPKDNLQNLQSKRQYSYITT